MKKFSKQLLGTEGFELNHHIKGGDVVILPLHTKVCKRKPCTCGAIDAMPKDAINGNVIWPEWRPK
jgi:hypothetical protein